MSELAQTIEELEAEVLAEPDRIEPFSVSPTLHRRLRGVKRVVALRGAPPSGASRSRRSSR